MSVCWKMTGTLGHAEEVTCRAIGKCIGRLIRQLSQTERRILASFTSPPYERTAEINAHAIHVMTSARPCPPIAAGTKVFAEDEFIVVCVFCARMRSREGPWVSLPLWLSQILRHLPERLSHTYCPECLSRYYPAYRRGAARSGAAEGDGGARAAGDRLERSSRSRMSHQE